MEKEDFFITLFKVLFKILEFNIAPWRCNEIALANLPRHWHCQNFHTPHFPCLLD
jgi:hypothetical protein